MQLSKQERFRLNKSAFDEIIGDPYAYPEPVQGHYTTVITSSKIRPVCNWGEGRSAPNLARPSPLDFCCDVENIVQLGLVRFMRGDKAEAAKLLKVFINTYIIEDDKQESFSATERREIEQIIGRILLDRHVAPIRKYFLTVRKKKNYD
jgi:hypothetical protein